VIVFVRALDDGDGLRRRREAQPLAVRSHARGRSGRDARVPERERAVPSAGGEHVASALRAHRHRLDRPAVERDRAELGGGFRVEEPSGPVAGRRDESR
jgi:hypothetical protein